MIAAGSSCTAGVLLVLLTATSASAQLRGTVTAGVGLNTIRPSAPELTTRTSIRPAIGRVPSEGWGMAMALNWFDAEVAGSFVGVEGRLGTLAIRPLLVGLGYTWIGGAVGISPSVVAGPALNTLDIDQELEEQFTVGGSRTETTIGTVSLAVRPGVSATYALAPRLGVTAFGGYLFNRPTFTVRTPEGDVSTRWSAGGVIFNVGFVVSLF